LTNEKKKKVFPLSLGVVKHVGDALFAKSPKAKSDIVCIGFSPWGVVEGRENLIGINVKCTQKTKIKENLCFFFSF